MNGVQDLVIGIEIQTMRTSASQLLLSKNGKVIEYICCICIKQIFWNEFLVLFDCRRMPPMAKDLRDFV